jgi:hypothetical protein
MCKYNILYRRIMLQATGTAVTCMASDIKAAGRYEKGVSRANTNTENSHRTAEHALDCSKVCAQSVDPGSQRQSSSNLSGTEGNCEKRSLTPLERHHLGMKASFMLTTQMMG